MHLLPRGRVLHDGGASISRGLCTTVSPAAAVGAALAALTRGRRGAALQQGVQLDAAQVVQHRQQQANGLGVRNRRPNDVLGHLREAHASALSRVELFRFCRF